MGPYYLLFILNTSDVSSYEDDNTPGKTLESVITTLEKVSNTTFKWFNGNQMLVKFQMQLLNSLMAIKMLVNASKCHVLISAHQKVHVNKGTGGSENST